MMKTLVIFGLSLLMANPALANSEEFASEILREIQRQIDSPEPGSLVAKKNVKNVKNVKNDAKSEEVNQVVAEELTYYPKLNS